MTISTEIRSAGPYTGNGVTTSFPFSFKVFASADVAIYLTDTTTGNISLLTAGFTVTLNADQDSSPGGTVVYTTISGPLPATQTLKIVSNVAHTQGVDLVTGGAFLPEVVEGALDRLTVMVQQLGQRILRTVRAPVSDAEPAEMPNATTRASKFLAFDASGNPIASAGTGGGDAALRTDLGASTGSSLVKFIRAGVNAVSRTLQAIFLDTLRVNDTAGVDPTGVTPCTAAINLAIADAQARGKTLEFQGTYLLDGVTSADGAGTGLPMLNGMLVPYTNANNVSPRVHFKGNATFKCNTNGMIALRLSDCHSGFTVPQGSFKFDANGKTGCWAIAIVPENMAQTTTVVQQLYNKLEGFYAANFDEGIVLQVGPKVLGVDSGCSYNRIVGNLYGCKRSLWLRNSTNLCSGNNRNYIDLVGGHGSANTGIQIDGGSQNVIKGAMEGCNAGVLPNATPTAVKIADADVWGLSNDLNDIDVACESNTRDLDNANATTLVGPGFMNFTNSTKFNGVFPAVVRSASPSFMPSIQPGLQLGFGVPGVASGYIASIEIADLLKNWQPFAITTGGVSNLTSAATNVSYWRQKDNGAVEWYFMLKFRATTSNVNLRLTPPATPLAALFTDPAAPANAWFGAWAIGAAGTKQWVELGFENTGAPFLYVSFPTTAGNWDAAANNNSIWGKVEYHT